MLLHLHTSVEPPPTPLSYPTYLRLLPFTSIIQMLFLIFFLQIRIVDVPFTVNKNSILSNSLFFSIYAILYNIQGVG